jgi:hypothetical protein
LPARKSNGDAGKPARAFPFEIEVRRERVEVGRTFSEDALNEIAREFALFVAQSVAQTWSVEDAAPQYARAVGTLFVFLERP